MSRMDDMPKRRGVSLLNWMGTLILSVIPGVNIIALILFAALGKTRSKRTFAGAALILLALCAILFAAAFLFFGDWLTEFAHKLAAE